MIFLIASCDCLQLQKRIVFVNVAISPSLLNDDAESYSKLQPPLFANMAIIMILVPFS